jgi:hypothetical protein
VPLLDPTLAVRAAIGLPLVLLLLRWRYALLIAWVLMGTLVGSSLPIFHGNNIDTALTIPTILLLAVLPVGTALRRMPALAALLVYLLWLLTGVQSSPLGTSDFLKTWVLYLDYALIAMLTVTGVTSRRQLLLLIDIMLAVGAFVALYGIYGYVTRQNVAVDSGTGVARILSVFTAAPPLALFLSIVIPLAIYRAVVSRALARLVALGILGALLMALVLTFSRGAILSVPLSLVVAALFLPSRRMRNVILAGTVGLAALASIVATVGNVSLLGRFSGEDVSSLNGRIYLWQALFSRFDPWRLQGNGLGAATNLLTRLNIGAGGVFGGNGLIAAAPSNLYIGTLYDLGMVGLALLLTVLTMLGVMLIRGVRSATGEHRLLFVLVLVVLINVLIQSLEVDDLWAQGTALYFWIAVSLPFAVCWSKATRAADAAPVPTSRDGELESLTARPMEPVGAPH